MHNSTEKSLSEKIALKVLPYQIKIELLILAIFIVGLAFLQLNIEKASLIITISASSACILYYLMALGLRSDNKYAKLQHYTLNWGFSALIAGLLFSLNRWTGSLVMLQVGLLSVIISIIAEFFLKNSFEGETKSRKLNILRAFILIVFLVGLYFNGNIIDSRSSTYQENSSQIIEE